MANTWIDFVKAYAKKHNMTYTEALKKAGPEFKKQKGSTAKTTAKGATAKGTTKKGNARKGAKAKGSRLAFDDTKQEEMKEEKDTKKRGRGRPKKK